MTKQEMFDKVWDYFLVKKNPPGWSGSTCEYSTMVDGQERRCAVGCLLPPLDKAPWVEHLFGSVATVLEDKYYGERVRDALLDGDESFGHVAVLQQLQTYHDRGAKLFDTSDIGPAMFRKTLAEGMWTIAQAYKLTFPTGSFDAGGHYLAAV